MVIRLQPWSTASLCVCVIYCATINSISHKNSDKTTLASETRKRWPKNAADPLNGVETTFADTHGDIYLVDDHPAVTCKMSPSNQNRDQPIHDVDAFAQFGFLAVESGQGCTRAPSILSAQAILHRRRPLRDLQHTR